MDDSISQYSSSTQSMTNKYMGLFKREYQSFGKAVNNVATSLNTHQTEQNKSLTSAIKHTGINHDNRNCYLCSVNMRLRQNVHLCSAC